VTGDAAVSIFAAACDASWIVAPVHKEHDYGLDLRVEVARGGYVTGEEFLVQVKGRRTVNQPPHLLPQAKISQSTINYWLAKLQPVMIVVVDLSSKDVYYDWLEHSYADYPSPSDAQREVSLPLRFANSEHSIHQEVAAYLSRYYSSLSSDMARLSKGIYLASLLFSVAALHRLTSHAAIELQRIEPETPDHLKQVLDQFCFEFAAHDSLLSGLRSGQFGHRPVSSRFFNKVEARLAKYYKRSLMLPICWQRTLMKDARQGLHSLVGLGRFPACHPLELNEHSPAQVQTFAHQLHSSLHAADKLILGVIS